MICKPGAFFASKAFVYWLAAYNMICKCGVGKHCLADAGKICIILFVKKRTCGSLRISPAAMTGMRISFDGAAATVCHGAALEAIWNCIYQAACHRIYRTYQQPAFSNEFCHFYTVFALGQIFAHADRLQEAAMGAFSDIGRISVKILALFSELPP